MSGLEKSVQVLGERIVNLEEDNYKLAYTLQEERKHIEELEGKLDVANKKVADLESILGRNKKGGDLFGTN